MKPILKGTIANKGIVKSEVFIIKSKADIAKFKSGAILVTKNTDPSFVTAMIKAKAILTDIGGITCHAAIVSRELGLPCIVGSKEATKKLKTGMMIELNADKGEVYEV
jgi:pyruvate, water dikinase